MRRAAKEHQCDLCREAIYVGESYHYRRSAWWEDPEGDVDPGTFWTQRACRFCEAFWRDHRRWTEWGHYFDTCDDFPRVVEAWYARKVYDKFLSGPQGLFEEMMDRMNEDWEGELWIP